MHANEIDWNSDESYAFVNPRTPGLEKTKLSHMIQEYKLNNHIFLATSGSTAINSSDIKWVALKKNAFLVSAQSVNEHLQCSKKDIFLNTLPYFHVGSLALFARAHLCNALIINIYDENYKWNPTYFVNQLAENKVTISSLVPTQVYDLVDHKLKAPPFLRAIVVGGGFLSQELYTRAQELHWPLLPSFGMTECCSQIATALPHFSWHAGYPELTVLPHLHVNLLNEGQIVISGQSLLTGYILQLNNKTTFIDPKVDDAIITSDMGEFKNNKLLIYGRKDENIKINGENVSLIHLQSILQRVKEKKGFHFDCEIISFPDPRQGQKIGIVVEGNSSADQNKISAFITDFNRSVFPYERIEQINFLKKIPRTELGKLKRNLIYEMIFNEK